jgi:NTE family protein
MATKRKKVALVLTGGGARGAYQAGILKAWEGILKQNPRIEIISGVSAGSVNALKLIQLIDNLPRAVSEMMELWSTIKYSDVYESSLRVMVQNAFNLIRSSRNRESGENISRSILSTEPLMNFLSRNFDIDQVHSQLEKDPELALAINCFDYSIMKNVAFIETYHEISGWERPNRIGIPLKLNLKHVMASCSVPFIFPTIKINKNYYGDGSLRNIAPLNTAIQLGAERIICINLSGTSKGPPPGSKPTLGNVAEAIFNYLEMDSVEYDSKVLNRINVLSNLIPKKKSHFRVIDLCLISPHLDFSSLVTKYQKKFPKSLKYLFGGWLSPDLMSFLMFEGDFCCNLIEQGRRDGKMYLETIEKWLLE